MEQTVLQALRKHLFTEENLRAVAGQVRDLLRDRARARRAGNSAGPAAATKERERERLRLEREIEHIKAAILRGKATDVLLGMLEDHQRRLAELSRGAVPRGSDRADHVAERLARVLDRLPDLVRERLDDLDTLLAADQVDKGKAILQALDTTVTLHPAGAGLDVEITGRIEALLQHAAANGKGQPAAESSSPSQT